MRRGLLLFVVFAACSDPTITEYEPRAGVITGTVLYPGGEARGNVVIALYRESAPPPPRGDGSPVNFVVVPEKVMFGEGAAPGTPFAAPFTVPSVPPGRYYIGAFLDA